MNLIIQNYSNYISKCTAGEKRELPKADFDKMLKDTKQKNGFVMANYEFTVMNGQLKQMKSMCDLSL